MSGETNILTTSSPALVSTCGRTMKRESLLSGVTDFFRPDKLELLSRDDEKDPALKPLDTVGD